MARKRMIDPAIWQSEDFSRLSTLAKLVFIGMFSQADDQGRGRAKAQYLKSILFPYDEAVRTIDIDKTLSEIGSNMSVAFYSHDGNEYYSLTNWDKWQKVDKPKPSLIPEFDETATIIRGSVADASATSPGRVPPNRIEQNKNKNRKEKEYGDFAPKTITRFVKPSVDEVEAYCKERKNDVDAQRFYDYYTANGWKVGKNPMKDWRAAVRTWERNEKGGGQRGEHQSDIGDKDPKYGIVL